MVFTAPVIRLRAPDFRRLFHLMIAYIGFCATSPQSLDEQVADDNKPAQSRKQPHRCPHYDIVKFDVTSMSSADIEHKIKDLYQKVDYNYINTIRSYNCCHFHYHDYGIIPPKLTNKKY